MSTPTKTPNGAGFAVVFFVLASLAIAGLAIATDRHPTLPLIIAGLGVLQLNGGRGRARRPVQRRVHRLDGLTAQTDSGVRL